MNKSGFTLIQVIFSILAGVVLFGGIVLGVPYLSKQKNTDPKEIPYYFIAIHNEPYHGERNQALSLESSYETLKKMIEKADQYDMKLTLMFTAQWVDYIAASEERMQDLEFWKKSGHEIGAHHHGLGHGNWDGYTDHIREETAQKRKMKVKNIEPYLGDLDDYSEKIKILNPDIKSGCMNDEDDKRELPDQMVYDTCSGFANYGETGVREGDNVGGTKGINEFISVGAWNGITRKWLTHFQANNEERELKAEKVFSSMKSGVYGAVFHSMDMEKRSFDSYLEFLHTQDPKGEKSKTVNEIIEQGLLPEKKLTEDSLKSNGNKKCGDNICDNIEKTNPDLCPKDCVKADSGERKYLDLKYSNVNSEAVKLDLYLPERTCSGKYPLVVMIHGGAFKGGDKREVKSDFLTKNCFAVASLNYRLSGEALFPAGNQDVKSAVRWLRANADKYNLDADNFGAMGGSAGGYYSSFLGVAGDTKNFDSGENLGYSSAVQAVVDEFGLVNIATLAKDRSDAGLKASKVESDYMGCDISSLDCKNAAIASPVNYASKGDAPFFILHGAKDVQIPIKQSQDFYNLLLGKGIGAEFTILPNAGHGGPDFDAYEPQIVEFFNKHLRK